MIEFFENFTEKDHKERSDKIISTKFERGQIMDPKLKPEFEQYFNKVRHLSERNYIKYKLKINPLSIDRGHTTYHLDHIYSVKDAFENNIPIEVVSPWTNLRIIESSINILKRARSDKTLEQLFEDFYKEQNYVVTSYTKRRIN
jgi:hypothetical protein